MWKWMTAIGAVMFIAGCIGAGIGVANGQSLAGIKWTGATWTISEPQNVNESKQLSGAGIQNVNVQVDVASVHVTSSPDNQVHIRVYGSVGMQGNEKDLKWSASTTNGTLEIDVEHPFNHQGAFPIHIGNNQTLSVDVALPMQFYQTVTVHAEVGKIQVEQLKAGKWNTGSNVGEVDVSSVQGAVEASTDTGAVRVEDVVGALQLRTGTGAIFVQIPDLSHNITAEAGVGAIHLTVDKAPASLQYHLQTNIGKAELNLPGVPNASTSGPSETLQGSMGVGGATVDLTSNVGAVTVDVQ